MTAPRSHREVERKLRVDPGFVLPDLDSASGLTGTTAHEPVDLVAIYHDTAALSLVRWGVTMRRRTGGADEGWHLKLPVTGPPGARDELALPLDAGEVGQVPAAFADIIAPLRRGLPVGPVATVVTRRTPMLLLGAGGRPLIELVDDHVRVERGGTPPQEFRELELELLDADDEEALAAVAAAADLLVAAGAQPHSVGKAATALGAAALEPPDVPQLPEAQPGDLAVDALRSILSQHVRHLMLSDIGVRRDTPDAVHQMRVAARRLRSTLATFRPLLEPGAGEPLREELKWIATELGAIRDTEVMQDRLDRHAGDLGDTDAARARDAVDRVLGRRLLAARSSALAALRSDRHEQLLDDLVALVAAPPVVDAAFTRADEVMLTSVAKAWRRLDRDVAALTVDGPSETWHEARIAAKRARYAAESVTTIYGTRMTRLARSLAEVTDVLGDHQDAHVAQGIVREVAAAEGIDGATGFALGLLHDRERGDEHGDRKVFRRLWPTVRRTARRAGVR